MLKMEESLKKELMPTFLYFLMVPFQFEADFATSAFFRLLLHVWTTLRKIPDISFLMLVVVDTQNVQERKKTHQGRFSNKEILSAPPC